MILHCIPKDMGTWAETFPAKICKYLYVFISGNKY